LMSKQFTLQELGVELNEEEAFSQLKQWEEGGFWTRLSLKRELKTVQLEVHPELNDSQLRSTMEQAYGSLIDRKPLDAVASYANPLKPTYRDDEPGIELDDHSLKQILLKKASAEFKKGEQMDQLIQLRMPLITLPPSTTVKMLEERKPNALLGRVVYDVSHLEDKELLAVNDSAKMLNGEVLVPGEELEERSFANSVESKLELHDSAGVYQAAAVMYQAALQSGLYVSEHTPSASSVAHVGSNLKEASKALRPELVIRNNTKGDIIWYSELRNGQLVVGIYGQKEPGVSYEIETIQADGATSVQDALGLKRLSLTRSLDEEEQEDASHPKEIYRIKRVDGKIVQREKISVSSTRHMMSTYSY
jgi:VanW like protein